MNPAPRWYLPVAIVALAWNLLGCLAYLADVRLRPEDIAALPAAQQHLYALRPAWGVAGTALAVWGGAAGCLGLALRRRWALPLLVVSLLGVAVQDAGLLLVARQAPLGGPVPYVLQSLVLVVSVALVGLARRAARAGWNRA